MLKTIGKRGVAAVLFLILSSCLAENVLAEQVLGNVTFDQDHEVFYQEKFRELYPRVQDAVPRAFHQILRRWELPDTNALRHPLTVQVKEVPSKTLQRWELAYVETRGAGNNLQQSLVVVIGAFMQHPKEDVEKTVTHEMSHVVLADIVGRDVPAWFNEGLAQSMTSEGYERVKEDIRRLRITGDSLRLCNLTEPVDEFAHGPFNGGCYPEFYLAVQRLQQLGGRHTVSKIVRGLEQGQTLPSLIQSLTGQDEATFKNEINHYVRDVFAGRVPIP